MNTISMQDAQRGVTLIELMTVVVVLAILGSIAVPSYRSYLLRAQRSDAKTALLQVQAAQEKFFLQNNNYTANLATAPPGGLGLATESSNGFYAIAVNLAADAQTYTATATPVTGKGQSDDTKCTRFSITDAGVRNAEGPGGVATCWR
jgi:type IV pilus assembly protein PilE